jgi:nucleoside phosphorylase
MCFDLFLGRASRRAEGQAGAGRRPFVWGVAIVTHHLDVDDIILNFDPAAPHSRFRAMLSADDLLFAEAALPSPVPWPAGAAPTPAPLAKTPPDSADLSQFKGYDALVVTWTAAEASAMATLFTPGHPTASWYEYRHNLASYVPLVSGKKAPFNDTRAEMARYYHSLGLYFPCTVRGQRVLLFKSGLHLAYDGPQCPVRKLMAEIAAAVAPRVFITTGTGGGIGTGVKLGDVVVAGTVKFDCTSQFKNEQWAKASYPTSALPAGAVAAMKPGLLDVNAARIPGARPTPQVFSAQHGAVVTTDFYAFDDSTDHYGLQGLGQACDMGDAMVGQALQSSKSLSWYSIRNASDPQIPNPNNNIEEASKQSALIYAKYGGLTTASSLVATWAIIEAGAAAAREPEHAEISAGFKLGRIPPERKGKP